ncbi:hypothetical protein [Mycobacterium sp. 155]|uniref:hypothetical protein n=1 Tax=Mycobacterium sp. 155 TaxID=1157943 RepID=UPI0012FB0186|nr:hypothetical protein [Mycobacterium sp. 155]
MTSVECFDKAMQADYVDQIVVYLQPVADTTELDHDGNEIGVQKPVGTPRTLVIGAPKPLGFRSGVKATFDDKLTVSVNGGPAQQWEPGVGTIYAPAGAGEHHLQVTVVNVRGVSDPYLLAKVLFTVGSAAAGLAAGYALKEGLAAIIAADRANDVLDIAKKIASGGGGGLVEMGLKAVAGLITDIFNDWPNCAGTVVEGLVPFDGPLGPKGLTTSPALAGAFAGCGEPPRYSVQLHRHPNNDFAEDKPVKWDCRYRPDMDVSAFTFTPWWRSDLKKEQTLYAVMGQHLDSSPIRVGIVPEEEGGLGVTVLEKTRDGKGVAFSRTFHGVKPEIVGIRTKPPGAVLIKPPPGGDEEGDRKPLGFTHQLDTTEVKLAPDRLPWWQAPLLPVVSPDRKVSRITLPEIDVQMDLYRKHCTSKDDVEETLDESVIYYRRGGTTARNAQGKPGFTVSTATLVSTRPDPH